MKANTVAPQKDALSDLPKTMRVQILRAIRRKDGTLIEAGPMDLPEKQALYMFELGWAVPAPEDPGVKPVKCGLCRNFIPDRHRASEAGGQCGIRHSFWSSVFPLLPGTARYCDSFAPYTPKMLEIAYILAKQDAERRRLPFTNSQESFYKWLRKEVGKAGK